MIIPEKEYVEMLKRGFRLLNSEIGNDPGRNNHLVFDRSCFRLLNSEIGNDQGKVI